MVEEKRELLGKLITEDKKVIGVYKENELIKRVNDGINKAVAYPEFRFYNSKIGNLYVLICEKLTEKSKLWKTVTTL